MLIDYTDPENHAKCARGVAGVLRGLRDNLRKQASTYNRVSPQTGDAMSISTVADDEGHLDVRLVANADGEAWFATGDVQYDTEHGFACEAVTLSCDDDDEAISTMADHLVSGVVAQLAESSDEPSEDEDE